MLISILCDYSDTYILMKGTLTIPGAGADAATRQADRRKKQVTFKICSLFTDCISKINNVPLGNAKDLGILMLMYNVIEHCDNYRVTKMTLVIT